MKHTYFLFLFAGIISTSTMAQIIKKSVPVLKQSALSNATPAPPPPSSTQKATGTENQFVPVYTLTAARVNIRTGHDNKEYPSEVRATIGVNKSGGMEYAFFVQENLKNEMRINSNTEFGLEKYINNNMKEITLEALQRTGLQLRIWYQANFQLDAWKIENISVTIEFRDQNGNQHPTLAQKTINFTNANGYLNRYPGTTTMLCDTDGYFNALSANIQ